MTGLTSITDAFGDGLHTFKLPFAQLEELQERTGAGPAALLGRLLDGSWRVGDLSHTIRLGLIGGGLTAADALRFVHRYVDGQPLDASVAAAIAILAVTLNGRPRTAAEASAAGEQAAAKPATGPDGSTSPPSDVPPASSASVPPS